MHHLSKRTRLLAAPALALAALAATAAVGSTATAVEDDPVVQACKHKLTGRLRAVATADACRSSELPISWSRQGPAGPAGPEGPAGPPGPKGDPGPGVSTLNALHGLACTRADGKAGTVDLEIANDGDVTLLCLVEGDPPPPPAGAKLVVNEIDYDQVGADAGGFVEIENTGTEAADLSNVALVLVDGSDGLEYDRTTLTGTLAAGAFQVVEIDAQNGTPDGVALVNTSTHALVDALSYEGAITNATIDGQTVSLVEGTALDASVADSNTIVGSLIRSPDGKDTNDASADWAFTTTTTPGAANVHTTL
jgi:Lamin Tail Domain